MKKVVSKAILFIEWLFLTVQALYFLIFISLTVGSSILTKSPADEDGLEANLIILLVFLFVSVLKSVVFSKILKLDLSYKGPNTFEFLPKWLIFSGIILFVLILLCSIIFKIHYFFIMTCAFTIFSILYQFSVIKYFSKESFSKEQK